MTTRPDTSTSLYAKYAAGAAQSYEDHFVPARVDLPADFFWQYVQSTPLAAVAADLDQAARAALERDVVQRCQSFVDGSATVMEPGALIVTGRRTGS